MNHILLQYNRQSTGIPSENLFCGSFCVINAPVGPSKKFVLRLCKGVDQQSETFEYVCYSVPSPLEVWQKFSRFAANDDQQHKMDSGIISWCLGSWIRSLSCSSSSSIDSSSLLPTSSCVFVRACHSHAMSLRHLKNYTSIYMLLNIKRHICVSYTTYNLSKKITWHIIFLLGHIYFFWDYTTYNFFIQQLIFFIRHMNNIDFLLYAV